MSTSKRKRKQPTGRKVVYDGLREEQHTFVTEQLPCPCDGPPHGHAKGHKHTRTEHTRINPGQVVNVGDLSDGSDRSRLIKGHLDREVCHYVGG